MKEILVKIDDAAYRRAEGIANARRISLSTFVEELVESVTNDPRPNSDDIKNLFSALDKGRNTEPIGPINRQELHDSRFFTCSSLKFVDNARLTVGDSSGRIAHGGSHAGDTVRFR